GLRIHHAVDQPLGEIGWRTRRSGFEIVAQEEALTHRLGRIDTGVARATCGTAIAQASAATGAAHSASTNCPARTDRPARADIPTRAVRAARSIRAGGTLDAAGTDVSTIAVRSARSAGNLRAAIGAVGRLVEPEHRAARRRERGDRNHRRPRSVVPTRA